MDSHFGDHSSALADGTVPPIPPDISQVYEPSPLDSKIQASSNESASVVVRRSRRASKKGEQKPDDAPSSLPSSKLKKSRKKKVGQASPSGKIKSDYKDDIRSIDAYSSSSLIKRSKSIVGELDAMAEDLNFELGLSSVSQKNKGDDVSKEKGSTLLQKTHNMIDGANLTNLKNTLNENPDEQSSVFKFGKLNTIPSGSFDNMLIPKSGYEPIDTSALVNPFVWNPNKMNENMNTQVKSDIHMSEKKSYADTVNSKGVCPITIKIMPKQDGKEKDRVEMPVLELMKGSEPYETTLCGFFIDKKLAFPIVKFFCFRMWKKYGMEDLMVNGQGFYFFKFISYQRMMDVIENGPWLINDVPIFVHKWKPGLVLYKPIMETVPVWVRVYDVPLEYWNEEGVAYIANELGKPISMDRITQKTCEEHWGRPGYMRLLIEMSAKDDWLKNLEVITVDTETGEKKTSMCRVEYAWWPSRCSNCQVYRHDDKNCSIIIAMAKEKEVQENVTKIDKGKGVVGSTGGDVAGKKVDVDGYTLVVRKNSKNNQARTSKLVIEDNKIDLIRSLLKNSVAVVKEKGNNGNWGNKTGKKQGNNQGSSAFKQGQKENKGENNRNNVNKFAIGAFKKTHKGDSKGNLESAEQKKGKVNQVYVAVKDKNDQGLKGNTEKNSSKESGGKDGKG